MELEQWHIISLVLIVGGLIYKFADWRGRVEEGRSSAAEFMKEIRGDIKTILERMEPRTVTGGSPLRLSSLGAQIADELDVKSWAEHKSKTLLSNIKDLIIEQSKYELQSFCEEYCEDRSHFATIDNRRIDDAAYNNAVSTEDIQRIYAVLLRDEILEKRGNVTVEEEVEITDDDIPF